MEGRKAVRILKWLKTENMSQEALAHQCGVTTSHMNQVLNGHYPNIGIQLLDNICAATGFDHESVVRDLLGPREEANGKRSVAG